MAVPPPQQKFLSMLAEIGCGGRVPGGRQRAPQAARLRKKPAERGDGAEIGIGQRRDQLRQPPAPGASIGIGEHIHVESFGSLLNGCAKIVHLFAAAVGPAGDHHVRLALGARGDSLDDLAGRVIGAGHREKYFVVGVIKSEESRKVLFQARLGALYRAKQGHARRVETGMPAGAPLRQAQPLQAVPKVVQALKNLLDHEHVEQCEHRLPRT